MKNLILIGMMGCGKTTVGTLLAESLKRELADTDALIERREGKPVSAIFSQYGEEYFRRLELEVSRALSRREGLVIACGGGLPLREEGIAALKGSGVVFWLNRDPGETFDGLDTANRPLAREGREGFVARYALRAPVYRRWADYVVAEPSPEAASRAVAAIYRKECVE